MKKFISYLSALCAVLLLSSCDKEEIIANKLLGTWEWVSSITYNSDGTTETEYADNANRYYMTISEDVISGDDGTALPYTFDGKTIYLLGGLATMEIEELTNKKLKYRTSSIFNDESYSIEEYKRK